MEKWQVFAYLHFFLVERNSGVSSLETLWHMKRALLFVVEHQERDIS